mmetsp:Transcript_37224/g.73752  ORF Transcript_37224/g.73752 Transcript_37224/m.73752 type:complete len:579 (-) Transcript_37224:64-1800(-)
MIREAPDPLHDWTVDGRDALGTWKHRGPSVPRKHGDAVRQAGRKKHLQDLVFRTEYLTSLRSQIAASEVPVGEDFRHSATAYPSPRVLGTAANRLEEAQQTVKGNGLSGLPLHYQQIAMASCGSSSGPKSARVRDTMSSSTPRRAGHRCSAQWDDLAASRPGSPCAAEREVLRGGAAHRTRAEVGIEHRTAWEAFPPRCSEHLYDGLHAMLAASPGFSSIAQAGNTITGQQNPLDTLKVQPIPNVPHEVLCDHHGHAAHRDITQHMYNCRSTQHVTEKGLGDMSAAGVGFAMHYWRKKDATVDGQREPIRPDAASSTADCWSCFSRADRHHEISGTRKMLLSEQSTAFVREPGMAPHHSHALVTGNGPVHIFAEGFYFEVLVKGLFAHRHDKSIGRDIHEPISPLLSGKHPERKVAQRGTEGLVIGVTTTPLQQLHSLSPPAKMATDVPNSWCIASSGKFYATGNKQALSRRAVNNHVVRPKPRWHQKEVAAECLTCPWPPPSETARTTLTWSVMPKEGDRLGMLVTSFGGIVLFVNGARELFLPDAGVSVGGDLYPLVEAFNHIRSVQGLPAAVPPK